MPSVAVVLGGTTAALLINFPLPRIIGLGNVFKKTFLFKLDDPSLKVPHIGWNEVRPVRPHPLLEGIDPGDEFYFVHSYYLDPSNEEDAYAVSDYGGDFCSAIGRGSFFATQFHPEKSGRFGLELLERFATWKGDPC